VGMFHVSSSVCVRVLPFQLFWSSSFWGSAIDVRHQAIPAVRVSKAGRTEFARHGGRPTLKIGPSPRLSPTLDSNF